MSEEVKYVRLQVSLPEAVRQRLEDLAATNAGENLSFMLRELINMAHDNPELFGLRAPRKNEQQ